MKKYILFIICCIVLCTSCAKKIIVEQEKNKNIYIEVINEKSKKIDKIEFSKSDVAKVKNILLNKKSDIDSGFEFAEGKYRIVLENDDGTINIYLGTTFETNDPNIYYSVVYTNFETGQTKEIYYTTSVAKYENAPFANYGISYSVYKNVNDVEHILKEIYVSGGIEFTGYLNINGQITTEDNINYKISYEFYEYKYQFKFKHNFKF